MTDVLRFIPPEEQSTAKLAELSSPSVCPIGNICVASTENAPPCGSVRRHLSPLPLSEKLCPDLSDRQIELEENPRTARIPDQRGFYLGSALTDRALGWDPGEPEASEDFDDAEGYLTDTAAKITHSMEPQFKSSLILAHFPLFKQRQADRAITAAGIQKAGEELTELNERVNSYPICDSQRRGMRARIGTLLLFQRSNQLVYPGLARESQNAAPVFFGLNHSGYLLEEGQVKTPVKLGKQRSSGRHVLQVTFRELLDNTVNQIPEKDRSPQWKTDIALAALIAEVRNEPVAPQHEFLLHSLSTMLCEQVDAFKRKQARQSP